MKDYGKPISVVVATIVSMLVAALADDTVTVVEWINVGIGAATAINVVIVPELDAGIAKHAKLIVAAIGAGLTALVSFVDGGVTTSEWLQVLLAVLGALGVVALPAPKHTANRKVTAVS